MIKLDKIDKKEVRKLVIAIANAKINGDTKTMKKLGKEFSNILENLWSDWTTKRYCDEFKLIAYNKRGTEDDAVWIDDVTFNDGDNFKAVVYGSPRNYVAFTRETYLKEGGQLFDDNITTN